MYYQTQSVSEDKVWTSCRIVEATSDKYVVEYAEDGEFKTKEISPEQVQQLDYCSYEISQ
jgi:hypothetical protein